MPTEQENNDEVVRLDGVCRHYTVGGETVKALDGVPQGETAGAAPFVCDPAPGEHEVLCASAEGLSASVRFKIVAQ